MCVCVCVWATWSLYEDQHRPHADSRAPTEGKNATLARDTIPLFVVFVFLSIFFPLYSIQFFFLLCLGARSFCRHGVHLARPCGEREQEGQGHCLRSARRPPRETALSAPQQKREAIAKAKKMERAGGDMMGDTMAIHLTYVDPSAPPRVVVDPTKSNALYTLIMWDRDAPYPHPRYSNGMGAESPFLHWLAVNAPDADFESPLATTLVDYIPPSPPRDSPPHTYIVHVLEQRGPFDAKLAHRAQTLPRARFPVFALEHAIDPTEMGEYSFPYPFRSPLRFSPIH